MMTISSAGSPKNQHLSINMIFQYQLQLNIHENPTSCNAYFYEQRSTNVPKLTNQMYVLGPRQWSLLIFPTLSSSHSSALLKLIMPRTVGLKKTKKQKKTRLEG